MNISDTHYFGYRNALAKNRDIFLLKFPRILLHFLSLDRHFDQFCELAKQSMPNGKNNVGLLPLINLMRRQAINAFDSLATMQSHQAWMAFRPSIEAALIMGKWMDDPIYATYWLDRDKYRKEYREHFWGDGLISMHLPNSKDIRSVLKKVNDEYMHLNSNYVMRSTIIRDINTDNIEIAVSYIDQDAEHAAHLYALVHVAYILLDSAISMLNAVVSRPIGTDLKVKEFEDIYAPMIAKLCSAHPDKKRILTDFGLWKIA